LKKDTKIHPRISGKPGFEEPNPLRSFDHSHTLSESGEAFLPPALKT
jgi:hypothetical protein